MIIKKIWDDLDVIMPGKTIVVEVPDSEYFHHQEIIANIESVTKRFSNNTVFNVTELHIGISKAMVLAKEGKIANGLTIIDFDRLFFNIEKYEIHFSSHDIIVDNALVF